MGASLQLLSMRFGRRRGASQPTSECPLTKVLLPRIIKGLLVVATLAYGAADANAAGRYAKKEAEVTATQTELTKPTAKAATSEPILRQKAFLPGSMDPIKVVTD